MKIVCSRTVLNLQFARERFEGPFAREQFSTKCLQNRCKITVCRKTVLKLKFAGEQFSRYKWEESSFKLKGNCQQENNFKLIIVTWKTVTSIHFSAIDRLAFIVTSIHFSAIDSLAFRATSVHFFDTQRMADQPSVVNVQYTVLHSQVYSH